MNSLEDMLARAQRQLDGMRVAPDRLAKDIQILVPMVRALQQQVRELNLQYAEATTFEVKGGSFNDAINEILDGLDRKRGAP